jgi:outer membrane protein TolC
MKIKLTLAVAGFLFVLNATAQQTSYSLLQAQEYAVVNSYSVMTATLEVEKSKKILFESIAQGLPQVFTSANWTKNINLQAFIADFGNGPEALTIGTPYTAVGNINAEQLIFDGSYIVAVMAADVLKENSLNELEKSEINIREQVAQSYHLVKVTDETKLIIEENLKFLRKNYDESKRMFEVGFMEQQDVDQLELIVSNLENNLDYADKQANIARMLLKFYMGIPVEQELILSDEVETLMLFSQDGGSLMNESFQLENHIEYRSLLTQEEGQNLNLKNEQMAFLPKLKFNYNFGYNIFSDQANVFKGEQGVGRADNKIQNIGLNISVPLITGGSRAARVQQAKIDIEQVAIAKEQVSDNLKVQYAVSKAEYDYALNSYFTQKRNVEISKRIRDVNSKKFAEGIVSSLEYTQAENQYQDALKNAIDAANNVLDKKVQLEKMLGKYNTIR